MSDVTRALPDVIYDEVRGRIVSGVLEPGQALRQDILAAEMGVSKIPLREALARLERDGLVVAHRNRGFEVRPLSADEAEEVFDLRLKIEPTATAFACRAATAEDRDVAAAALERLDRALATGEDLVSDANRDFHLALVRPGGRRFTVQLVESLHTLAERYVRAHLKPEGRAARARHEHRDLFDAWSAGRPHMVETQVRTHISGALDDLRRQLRT